MFLRIRTPKNSATRLIAFVIIAISFRPVDSVAQPAGQAEKNPVPAVKVQPAIPEIEEFRWKDIRYFNLPLNNPPVVRPAKADFLRGDDVVIGVVLGEKKRAYPWALLANFHAVNDRLDNQPIIVTLCEACNGGAAFLATVQGTTLDLRPRGLKNGTWYGIDFQTGSLWYPFIGEAFEGPLKGTKLTRIRAYFSTWKDWVREHPETTVAMLSDEVRLRPHGRASRMAHETTFNPVILRRITNPEPNPKRDLLPGHTLVFGMIPATDKEKPRAYTLDSLEKHKQIIQFPLNGVQVLLLLKNKYQVGAYQAVLNEIPLEMKVESNEPFLMVDQFGNRWDMWGRSVSGPDHPQELPLADGYLAKWYEWVENFPATELAKPK